MKPGIVNANEADDSKSVSMSTSRRLRKRMNMKIQKVFRSLIAQASVLAILLISLCAVPSRSYLTDTLPSDNVSLPGVHGATNNTVYAFDRYILAAPFAPSGNINDGSDIRDFDNHFLYLFDTKKPESSPKFIDLKICYFPTKVIFDENNGNVFVRGTEFVEVGPGQYETREVIVHTHLNLESDGRPAFAPDNPVPIRIKGNGTEYAADAPIDFALGHSGRILVFTNGSSIFTYDVVKGDFYPVVIDYSIDNVISFLDIDEASNTLIVATSKRIEGIEGGVKFTSELYFYKLEKDGTVNSIKRLLPVEFGEGIFLSAGSNAAISWDPNTETPEYGYFVTNDGALCQVDLRTKNIPGVIERVALLPELAQAEGLEPGPVTVNYERGKRLLTVVKRGTFWNIRRPSFIERSGRIRRPSFSQFEGSAAIALVQFNKKNRIVGQRVFDKVFGKENRISNLVAGQTGIALVATHSGMLFALDTTTGTIDRAEVNQIGEIGSRIDYIAYNAGRQNLAAVSSCHLEEGNPEMVPGSLLFARVPLKAD